MHNNNNNNNMKPKKENEISIIVNKLMNVSITFLGNSFISTNLATFVMNLLKSVLFSMSFVRAFSAVRWRQDGVELIYDGQAKRICFLLKLLLEYSSSARSNGQVFKI